MLTFKKRIIIEFIILAFLLVSYFLFQNPSIVSNIFLIDSRAIQQSLALSITIGGCAEESKNATALGQVDFTDICNKPIVPKVTNLPAKSNIKLRVFYTLNPQGFTAPSATEAEEVFNYFNLTLNTTLAGTATIFFNVSQTALGATSPSDVKLFKYTTSWQEQPTTIVDSSQFPVSFSAEVTSFSKFLIGKKSTAVTVPLGAGGEMGKGAIVYIPEKPTPTPRPIVKLPEAVKKIIQKIIKLPKALMRYKIEYKIIYIATTILISIIIILEAIYYLLRKKWNQS